MARHLHPCASLRAYFGWRLRHWRLVSGMTQRELGRRLGYDHTHLSKVESGDRWPPPELPNLIDRLFDTGGELAALWPLVERERQQATRVSPAGLGDGGLPTSRPGSDAVAGMEALLRAYHAAGDEFGSRDLITSIEHHTRTVVQWQAGQSDPPATALVGLAAKFALLAAWARFDGTDYATALFWATAGQQWATMAGDVNAVSRSLTRQSSVHWSVGNPAGAIAIAEAARRIDGISPEVNAWACLAQARGHAFAGDRRNCELRLAEAADLIRSTNPKLEPWNPGLSDVVLPLATGTCYRDLAVRVGLHELAEQAVVHITSALTSVPLRCGNVRAVVATRLASAHVSAEQPDEAIAVLTRLVDTAHGSARMLNELRAVHSRLVTRWADVAAVRKLTDQMQAANLIPTSFTPSGELSPSE
ncbi:helix-turn-helix domain-containing protein [Micromonospora sp. LZ34]